MKTIKTYFNLLRLMKIALWSRYWAIKSKDPLKRDICMVLFTASHQTYNHIKPSWWPKITPPTPNL